MSKQKILYLFSSSNYSGAELVITRLMEKNKLVQPLTLCPDGAFADLLREKGIAVKSQNALKALNRAKVKRSKLTTLFIVASNFLRINATVFFMILRYRLRIVHANNLSASVYILPLVLVFKALRLPVKFVWSNHDLVYPDGQKMDNLAEKCVKYFDTTLAVSLAVKNKFSTGLHPKIAVLYNGLDLEAFKYSAELRSAFRQRIDAGNDIVFAIVGLIIPRKGHLLLIEAFNKLTQRYGNIRLLIVGKFIPNEHDYEQAVRALVDNKHIYLQGYTHNVVELYSGIDVLINASLPEMSEPLGTTIYEAMAINRVVVASDTGGSPEIVTDKKNGFLFRAGDAAALEAVLAGIVNNWGKLDEIRDNARKLTEEKFNVDAMVKNYNGILKIA